MTESNTDPVENSPTGDVSPEKLQHVLNRIERMFEPFDSSPMDRIKTSLVVLAEEGLLND